MANWKNIWSFSAGLTIGSVISYFVLKKRAEKELLEAIETEKEALQKAYKDRGAAILKAQEAKDAKKVEEIDADLQEARIDDKKKLNAVAEDTGYKPKIDYTKYSKKVKEEFAESETPSEDDRKTVPYMIFEDDYSDDLNYDKEELVYFGGNGVLCDVDETIFNLADTIGEGAVELFDVMSTDTIYIRNERLQTDYMVERRQAEYVEGIMRLPHI